MLNKKGSCVLSLHVGWGKTLFSIYLASKLKFKTLIIVNRLVLVKQWGDAINQLCPQSTCQFVKTKSVDENADFYIINAANVCKMPIGYFSNIGTVICDEVHRIAALKLYSSLFYVCPRYSFALSATPYRLDGLDKIIDLYFGVDKIVKELYREHVVYAIHTHIKIDYDIGCNGKMDWNSVLCNQSENTERNQMIIDIILHFSTRCFLVLCKRISQCETLIRLLQENNQSVTDLLGKKIDFDENARIVVATSQKCGIGFSHERLDALIIASDVQDYYIQYLGRVFRTPDVKPIVFDFIDDLSILKKHFTVRKQVYTCAGGKVNMIKDIKNLNIHK